MSLSSCSRARVVCSLRGPRVRVFVRLQFTGYAVCRTMRGDPPATTSPKGRGSREGKICSIPSEASQKLRVSLFSLQSFSRPTLLFTQDATRVPHAKVEVVRENVLRPGTSRPLSQSHLFTEG